MATNREIDIFIAYSHSDQQYLNILKKHLSVLEDDGVSIWYDGEIMPGQEWDSQIKSQLNNAKIILLLISIDFLTSQYIRSTELPTALNRHKAGECTVVPVILRSCAWRNKLGDLQALPKEALPIESWINKDDAYHNVFEGIERLIISNKVNNDIPKIDIPKQNDLPIKSTFDKIKESMILVEGGTYEMGIHRPYQFIESRPAHMVKVSNFHLSESLVTREQYLKIMEKNSTTIKQKDDPISRISWEDAQAFCKKLNDLTGRKYRLPSEAEWEFAARGKGKKKFEFAGSDDLSEVGWYKKNAKQPNTVKTKKPNSLNIYDMSGNVFEFCEDIWHNNYEKSPKDSKPWLTDGEMKYRVVRGGSFMETEQNCKVFSRNCVTTKFKSFDLGFRLAHDYPM